MVSSPYGFKAMRVASKRLRFQVSVASKLWFRMRFVGKLYGILQGHF